MKSASSLGCIPENLLIFVSVEFRSGAAFRGRVVSLLVASSCGVSRFDF